jgi:uncharacterized membrane protein
MEWIRISYLAIEYLAVAIIVGMAGFSTIRFFISLIAKKNTPELNYREYKHSLGAGLLLGLEILVAADVIRTVALEPTFENIASLGLLVLVRTFLSWALVVEIEGRWPWQKKHDDAQPGGHSK